MRTLIIGKERKLRRGIKDLEAAGYVAAELPGAVHLGRGVWIFPVEVTRALEGTRDVTTDSPSSPSPAP